jgi:RES domain-containing protein
MSENRSLTVLEILVHLSASIPDRYVLGSAEVPNGVSVEFMEPHALPENWSTLDPRAQGSTRSFGDGWVREQRSAILSVPSVVAGERNFVLNPAHPDVSRIVFADPIPFQFDARLLRAREQGVGTEHAVH